MHHRTPLMVLALSVVLIACGDEDDGYSKKNTQDGGGRPRSSSTGGKPGASPDGRSEEDAGDELDPDALDGGETAELDGSAGGSDAAPGSDATGGGSAGDAGTDGATEAGSVGADGSAGELCASPGEGCESAECCSGATCILEPDTGDAVCAAECAAPGECNSGCCLSVRDSNVGACGPARYCEAPPVPTGDGCDVLVLIAEDGTFLGNAVSSPVAANGVCNDVSPHGSSVGPRSIFNSVGVYGSTVSAQSAYNSITSTPPALMCAESREIVAFVTKNSIVAGAPLVDPDALCIVLANSGL